MGKEMIRQDREALEKRRKELQGYMIHFMLDNGIFDYREAAKLLNKKSGKTKHNAKLWQRRWQKWMQDDEDFQSIVGQMCLSELRSAMPANVAALNRRAAKGNVPAIKLAMEAAGFYSPRTTHEHVGEIAITLKGLTRPPDVVDEDTVVDANVVED